MFLTTDETVEANALTVSSFIRKSSQEDFQNPLTSQSPFLKSLEVNFKYIKGQTFWQANEAELEYIYYDFCKASRNVLVELHPDRGGDGHEFGEFAKLIGNVKKSFWKKGIGKDITLFV